MGLSSLRRRRNPLGPKFSGLLWRSEQFWPTRGVWNHDEVLAQLEIVPSNELQPCASAIWPSTACIDFLIAQVFSIVQLTSFGLLSVTGHPVSRPARLCQICQFETRTCNASGVSGSKLHPNALIPNLLGSRCQVSSRL